MTIRMQYPNISGNPVCDGTVHQIEPIRLRRVIGLPLMVLEYLDRKIGAQCITIISVDAQGFHKVPLLGYNEFFEILSNDEWLEPIDIRVLPDTIGSNEPVHDWPEVVAESVADSPNPNNPPILRAAADDKKPHRPG